MRTYARCLRFGVRVLRRAQPGVSGRGSGGRVPVRGLTAGLARNVTSSTRARRCQHADGGGPASRCLVRLIRLPNTQPGVAVAAELVAWRRAARLLQAVTGPTSPRCPAQAHPAVRLRVPRQLPKTLGFEEITVILAACEGLRDRFLFALLATPRRACGSAKPFGCGMRTRPGAAGEDRDPRRQRQRRSAKCQ